MNFTFPAMCHPPSQTPAEDDLAGAFPRVITYPRFSATRASIHNLRVGLDPRKLHTNGVLFALTHFGSDYRGFRYPRKPSLDHALAGSESFDLQEHLSLIEEQVGYLAKGHRPPRGGTTPPFQPTVKVVENAVARP